METGKAATHKAWLGYPIFQQYLLLSSTTVPCLTPALKQHTESVRAPRSLISVLLEACHKKKQTSETHKAEIPSQRPGRSLLLLKPFSNHLTMDFRHDPRFLRFSSGFLERGGPKAAASFVSCDAWQEPTTVEPFSDMCRIIGTNTPGRFPVDVPFNPTPYVKRTFLRRTKPRRG